MEKDEMKVMMKKIMFILIWLGVCFLLANILKEVTTYKLGDILLIEGILLISAGSFSVMDLKGEEVSNNKRKREKAKSILKSSISIGISMIPMVFGGVCSIILGMMLL